MKAKLSILLGLITAGIIVNGCSKEVESESIEQIYAREGVPIRTSIVKTSSFIGKVIFTDVLTGIEESSAFAAIDDKIDKIYYQVGDYIEKDSVVISFPTDNPSARYYQAQVSFENARASYERMKSYYESGGLSRQDFENAEAAFKVAEANWDAVRQAVKVRAPISGILTRINLSESENVSEEDELFTVSQIDRLKARVYVSDKDIINIKPGQKASATWNGITLRGQVRQADLSMNQSRKAFGVVLDFANSDHNVRCGVTADITIETRHRDNVIVLNRKDIISDGNGYYVYLNDKGTARTQRVKLGVESGVEVEILEGLRPGDELIVQTQMLLEDGMKVKIIGSTSKTVSPVNTGSDE